MWWNYPLTKGKKKLCEHPIMTNTTIFWTLLRSNETHFFKNFVIFRSGKRRHIVYQRTCWISWWIFIQHGLYGILLTVYSALSRLTDHGIYYITRCRIWLLTIFHIPSICFQRELGNFTPQKLYFSFCFSIYTLSL